MFAACAVFLLCLMSVSRSSPLACEDSVRPLDRLDPRHLEGSRALVAATLSHLPFMERLRRRESATSNFSNSSEAGTSWSRSMRLDNKCHYASYNVSLEGCSFTFDNGNVSTTFIRTSCRDCILMSFDVDFGKRQHLYLFSRRRELEQEELDDFRAQVECLKMPPPVLMDPTKELCPEEKHRDRRSERQFRQDAPLACEDSARPLDQLHPSDLEGRWVLIAGSLSDPAHLENFKRTDSVKFHFVNASEASAMSFTGIFGVGVLCRYMQSNITLEGPSFALDSHNLTVTGLHTSCPDCALLRFDSRAKELKRVYLFSRRKEVEQEEMEAFKAQVECLNMPPPVVMDPTKDFCQDQIAPKPAAQTGEKTVA